MIRFVLIQTGCPCCCSEYPYLLSDLEGIEHVFAVGDESEIAQAPKQALRQVYKADFASLDALIAHCQTLDWETPRPFTATDRKVIIPARPMVI